jgi:hypothetical protein
MHKYSPKNMPKMKQQSEELSLSQAVTHLLEECRMVLPGMQALFGFQLISVFNSTFSDKLTSTEQKLHLVAIALVVIAIALVMAPAAYHRRTGAKRVTEDFVVVATRLLLLSMFPLMVAICLDFYLIARLVLHRPLISILLSFLLLFVFSLLWFALPWWRTRT